MNFEHSDKVKDLLARVSKFMDDNIYPAEAVYAEQMQAFRDEGNPWQVVPIVEELPQYFQLPMRYQRYFLHFP